MATFFRNTVAKDIGTTPREVIETADNSRVTVIGMSLTNITENLVTADISLDDGVTTAYFIKGVIVPANQSLRVINGGEKLIMGPSTQLIMSASTDAALDLVMSYVEIT
jgi:hypothetical protein